MAWGILGLGSGCFSIHFLIKANCRSGTRTWTLLPVWEGGLVFFMPKRYHMVALVSMAKVDVADGLAEETTGPLRPALSWPVCLQEAQRLLKTPGEFASRGI